MRPDDTIGDALVTDTPAAQALLETLRNGPIGGLADVFPELGALVDEGDAPVRFVELPDDLRSYLQPGYEAGLAGKLELTDEADRPVCLPDSNCVIVVEKG